MATKKNHSHPKQHHPDRRNMPQSTGPDPADTNYVHPGAKQEQAGVPGEGVVGEATAAGAETHPDSTNHPGRGANARDNSTTWSGVSAVPSQRGGVTPNSSPATETPSTGGGARLSMPGQSAGPSGAFGSAGPAARETNDPNYTAQRVRESQLEDGDVTRMDTTVNSPGTRPGFARMGDRINRVSDVMTRDVAVCNPQTEIVYVARVMGERNCGAIPVVDSTDTMQLVGIITDRDLAIRVIGKNQNPADLRASDVMTSDPHSVRPDTSLEECAERMEQLQVRRMPVVDANGRCCGIIAQADFARMAPPQETAELVQEISEPDGG